MGGCIQKQASVPQSKTIKKPVRPQYPSIEDIILQNKTAAIKNKKPKQWKTSALELPTI